MPPPSSAGRVCDVSDEARSTPELKAASAEEERPSGLPDQKSAARKKTPVPEEPHKPEKARRDETPLRVLRPPAKSEPPPAPAEPRPSGLRQLTTSARLRLQLVFDDDDRPRVASEPPPDPKKPPSVSSAKVVSADKTVSADRAVELDPRDVGVLRSLGRWIGVCGLMTMTVGALTGLSYFTGEGKVANVVVGILASALSVWLLAAAVSFHRAAGRKGKVTHHLVSGFSLLRSAFLLKAILLFAAMALGCFTFSLATSLLFLL